MVQKTSTADRRQRHGRRDERDDQLRKKLQAEIGKRHRAVGRTQTPKKRPQGSVMALKPLPPVTMDVGTSVLEAAQYMSARRANGVLVVDGDGAVVGIFTVKDIAFKVVGQGKSPREVNVEDIMTANPTVTDVNTNATEALNMMVRRGFRHLPVIDEEDGIAGVLDITKCFYEAMQRLERAYESSRKLQDALEGVSSEFGHGAQPAQFLSYVEALRERTAGPDLGSVLDGRQPVYVDLRTNVRSIAELMVQNRTTAVLVTDNSAIKGIFTTKDLVLRVVAAGLDPATVSVVRVMTPNPDSAPIGMSIQEALRKMHTGNYLNLPVMDVDSSVVGVVDVLKLTYATLEQINSMSADNAEGPAWNKFWMSLDETSSQHSDSNAPTSTDHLDDHHDTGHISASASEIAQFSIPEVPELVPEDSLSRAGQRDDYAHTRNLGSDIAQSIATAIPETFAFKFKAPHGRVHRIQITTEDGLEPFRQAVVSKLSAAELSLLGGAGNVVGGRTDDGFAISYVDEDGDPVSITTDNDVVHAVRTAQRKGDAKAEVFLHTPDTLPEVAAKFDATIPLFIGGGIAVVAIAALMFRGKK